MGKKPTAILIGVLILIMAGFMGSVTYWGLRTNADLRKADKETDLTRELNARFDFEAPKPAVLEPERFDEFLRVRQALSEALDEHGPVFASLGSAGEVEIETGWKATAQILPMMSSILPDFRAALEEYQMSPVEYYWIWSNLHASLAQGKLEGSDACEAVLAQEHSGAEAMNALMSRRSDTKLDFEAWTEIIGEDLRPVPAANIALVESRQEQLLGVKPVLMFFEYRYLAETTKEAGVRSVPDFAKDQEKAG